ncbi:hypothetical protein BJ742DRAFT_830456 [Cladochytrium replicatum]|nr:hypothetical protein BJ742DRAFT_830456 [Cladochytrium replicatum]
MRFLLDTIEFLHSLTEPSKYLEMPVWMQEMFDKLASLETTMNVKLFLARVVLNYPAAFRPFATTFWRPLAQLIADGIQYTSGINYFIQDICVELLSWTAPGDNDKHHAIVPTEDDRLLIFNMLNFLISHAYHPSGSVLNSNVKIIQLFVQNWTNFVTVPVDCVFRLLQSDETCKAGLYIVSAFVVNGILPHTAMANVSMRQFDGALVRHLGSSQRKVYSAASITIGQLLALYKQREFSNDLEGLVQAKLDELRRSPDPKASVTFIVTMSSISPYYPKLVAHNANDIVFKFPLFPDSVKAKALEALSSVVQDKPSILVDLYGQGLIAILKHRHEECQIMALYVLYQGADNLSAKQIEAFLPVATDVFTTHPSENSREAFYRLILRLYKNHPSKPNIKRQLTLAILKSIDDPSHNVSQLGKHYVGQERLSKSVNERTLELLSEWWMPETEDSFVNTASALILEASRDAPAHKEKLFAEGLPSAKFSDKPLVFDVSWSQSTAMQPLFVGSLMSDRINSHENPYNGVRATQTMDWTPTIDLSAEATRSLFSLNAAELPVNTFSSSSLTHNSTKSQSRKEEFYALRRRAYKQRDSGATRSYFAREAETEKRRQRAEAKRQREERARKVSLIREYREGELPDIEITVKEILDPLQALVQRDNEAAQIVFCSLMSDLIRNVDESGVMTEDLATEQLDHYRDYLRKILTKSTQHHSPLFGAILRILYERPGLAPEISILAQAAISSWNNELGAMVIEKLMANHSERSTKRIRTTAVSSPWAYLAKVYKSMTNMEVYQNIYEYHISSTPVTQVAISLESLGNYFGAARKYQEGLTSEPHSSEASIWMSGQMECLSKLYEWDELLVCLKNEIEDDVRNVWDPERPELLRQYIRAQLRIGGSSALDFLTKSLESEQKRYVLESEYPYELASVYVMNRDWNRANFYIGTFIDMFSTSFTSIHPLSRESRLSVLSSLQKGKELHEFCTSASKSRQGISKITNLIDTWKLRFPSKVDPIDTWDDIITSRYMCLNVFNRISAVDGTQTPSDNTSTISGDMKSADHSAFKLYTLKYISAALKQQNWGLALRLSQKLVDERTQDVQYAILKTWQQRVADEFDKSNQVDSWSILLESIQNKSTISCFQSGGKMWQSKFSLLRSRTYEILVEFLLGRSDVPAIFSRWQDSMGKTIRRIAAESSSEIPNNPQELVAVLCASGRKCLEDGAQKLENTHGQTSQNALFKAQVRLASHCDKVLRLEESGSVLLTDEDRRDYSENLVVYNLRSMCNGIDEAINMFPRLLQLLERHNDLITTFVNQSSNVPTWMFLRWLPQMTAALSTSVAEPVSIILLRVASEYPNALFFPFRISSEGFTPEVLKNVGKSVEKLRTALEFQQMEEFIRELARLGEPVHIFKDWLDRGQDLFEKGLIPELRKSFLEMAELIFETPQNRKRLGAEGLKFSSRHYKKISEICGKDGAKLSTAAAWKSIRKYAQESFRDEKLGSGSTLLKSYSPWLSSFLTDNQEEIEVPGQYTGLAKPVPSWHAKIASFGPTMLTMSSMRRPKRLQINGTDEKEYLWLVKGGEDLRLDQRVEQMFSIMNAMLAKTPYCVAHQVSVSDYKVVPMSVRLGIIEWVPKTMPLRSCMSNHPDFEKELRSVTQKHQEWIASHARGKGVMEAYPVMLAANVKRETLESQMNELWNLCKTPYLRVFLMKLASSIESFLTIRSGFARSLGALNICSYILGIGDRHSDNFLIDLTSGKVIGIDFGHAFGSATEILPIPELVPFRLTKQIQYVLEPLGVSVLMEITMIKVLESLKKNKSTLLNALDVFVKEPLMEWRKFALSQAKKMARMKSSQQATPSSADTPEASFHAPAWYPIQKLEIVRRKLDGDNPAYIVSEELRRGHEEKPWCKNMQLVALGTTKQGSTSRSSKQQASSVATTLRGRIGERCETTKEQVNCLVELATDPAVLLRAYLGWGPYI